MPLFHHRFREATKKRLREYAEARGCTPEQVEKLEAACDDRDAFEKAVKKAKATKQVGAFGDGTLLKEIVDWLKSDQGQAFIKILFTLLMGLMGETAPAGDADDE